MTIPLVPLSASGEVTHVEVGVPVQFGVVSDVVIVELSKYDCWEVTQGRPSVGE